MTDLLETLSFFVKHYGVDVVSIIIAIICYIGIGLLGWYFSKRIPDDLWPVRVIIEVFTTAWTLWVISKYKIKERNKKKRCCQKLSKWIMFIIAFILAIWGIGYTLSTTVGLPSWFPGEFSPNETDIENGIIEDDLFPYENIEDVPECDFKNKIKHNCIYYVVENVNADEVSSFAYSEERFQGKIKEFYRDEKGDIPLWRAGGNNFTLIPPLEMDLDLYTKYFALLNISRCDDDATNKPCWQESKVESYAKLAEQYYGRVYYIECIKLANKIEYDAGSGLKPMEIKVGDIVVLPVCD